MKIGNTDPISAQTPRESKATPGTEDSVDAIKESARNFSKMFMVQILKDAGFDKAMFSGLGTAGDAYGSFLLEAVAEKLSHTDSLGIRAIIEGQLIKQRINEQ